MSSSTERIDPTFDGLDQWPLTESLGALIEGQRRAIDAVAGALPALAQAAAGILERLAAGGRLAYAGAGTSGRLGYLDAAELPPTFGFSRTVVLLAGGMEAMASSREGAEDAGAEGTRMVAEAGIDARDALIGLAASGRTPFTLAAVRAARARGAFTVAVANVPDSPLLAEAEVAILLDTGPEVLAGSTRLAAGTAQKATLNALSTAVLVQLGGAYGNLMVGMQATNEKLRQRAIAIVCAATGAPPEAAAAALGAAGEIRGAIVMLRAGVGAAVAADALRGSGGRVRQALTVLGAE
jgi:N-acetylmuramic acid 6-phosphate etherase